MEFRRRLLETLRALQPIFREPGILVVGSEVPNLLEPNAASTLVVSQDVDIGVPIVAHGRIKAMLVELTAFRPAPEEPSVRLPVSPNLLEVNFLGIDSTINDAAQTYVLEDADLPLLVLGPLGLLQPGSQIVVDDVRVPLPKPAGLVIEKLLTDRSGEKGGRDLLVAAALLWLAQTALDDVESQYGGLAPDQRYLVRSNLTLLSLLEPQVGMPDPRHSRAIVAELLARLERRDPD